MFSLLLAILLSQIPFAKSAGGIQSVSALDGYKLQRICALNCFVECGGRCTDKIAAALGCDGSSNALDSCWCRPDLQPSANAYLSSCISYSCSSFGGATSIDISAAVGLYNGYCTGKGYSASSEVISAASTSAPASTSASTSTSAPASASEPASTLAPASTSATATTPSSTTTNITPLSTNLISYTTILTAVPTVSTSIQQQPTVTATKVLVPDSSAIAAKSIAVSGIRRPSMSVMVVIVLVGTWSDVFLDIF